MSVLIIAKRLATLAKAPENRARIVRDQNMLPTLTVFLENGDGDVIRTSLEAIELLAQEPSNHAAIRNEAGLLPKINAIIAKHKAASASASSSDTTTATTSDSAHTTTTTTTTTATLPPREPSAAAAADATTETPTQKLARETYELAQKICEHVREAPLVVAAVADEKTAFVTPTKKAAVETINIQPLYNKLPDAKIEAPIVNYVFFVKGLHGEEQRDKVEAALLATNGVLSFWFDIYQQKAEIRARCDEKALVNAIKTSGFVAVQWRGEGSPHAPPKAGEEKTATKDDSGYLEENEDPQVTASHSYGSGGWLGTLSIFGKTPNKKKDTANSNNGLFGKIKSSWW